MRNRAVRALVIAMSVIAVSGASTSIAAADVWPSDTTGDQNPWGNMLSSVTVGNSSTASKWTFSIDDSVYRFAPDIAVSNCVVRVTIWYNGVAQVRKVVPCAPFSTHVSETLLTYTIARPPKGTFVEAKTAVEGWIYGTFQSSGNAYIYHVTAA